MVKLATTTTTTMTWPKFFIVIFLVSRPAGGQYQLVREDPFAALSATLVTRQAAACDGEFAHLRCSVGAKVEDDRLHFFYYFFLY